MNTWHATLTYTLAVESDVERLSAALADHDGTVGLDGTRLAIELSLRSVHIESLQAAARLATYLARRALYAAELVVESENGLTVVLQPATEHVARAEGA
jgi:hypothetical protein